MVEIDGSVASDQATGDSNGRPLPEPSRLSKPFWDGCRVHHLVVPRCDECGTRFFGPEVVCPTCWSRSWRWVESPGTGTVYSFSVVYRPGHPSLEVPYVLASVDLDDGWTMLTNIVDCPPEEVRIGAAVGVRFEDVTDEISLPMFAPIAP